MEKPVECTGVGAGRRVLAQEGASATVSIYSPRLASLHHQDHCLSDSEAAARPSEHLRVPERRPAPSPLRFRRCRKAFVSTSTCLNAETLPLQRPHWNKQGKEALKVTPTVPPLQPTQKGTQRQELPGSHPHQDPER